MALLTRQILGTPRGSVGDFVYKGRKGKSYVAPKPNQYKKTKCLDSINNRKRFGLASKFASVVNESRYLKPLWKFSKLPGKSAYSKIYKDNYPYCYSNFLESGTHITPEGKYLQNVNIHLDEDSLEFTFNMNKDIVDSFVSPCLIVAIIYLYQPIAKETLENKEVFVTFEQEIDDETFNLNDINKLQLLINKGDLKIINDYNKAVVYFTIICFKNKFNQSDYTNGNGHHVKGFEFYDAEMMAMRDLKPKKSVIANEPVNNFRIR